MKKIFTFLAFCVASFAANEANLTIDTNKTIDINQTSPNIAYAKFSPLNFKMPSDTAVINKITISYIDAAGVFRDKVVEVNRSIEWNDEFVLQKKLKPEISRSLDVSVTTTDPNAKNLAGEKTQFVVPVVELPLEALKFDDNLKFIIKNSSLKILTKDELKDGNSSKGREFRASFYRDDMNLTRASFGVKKGGFNDINIIKKEGFYDVEISLKEGNFTLQKNKDGYELVKSR